VSNTFTSSVLAPRDRGEEFGTAHRTEIRNNLAAYERMFAAKGALGVDEISGTMEQVGGETLSALDVWAPALADEIRGMAYGAALSPETLAALNARTELVARLRVRSGGECSTVVALGDGAAEPIAAQNWDCYYALADGWLVWEIPHDDGRRTVTLTEYGILGKLGINDRGLGVLINLLNHARDGRPQRSAVPVHIAARRVLDDASTVDEGLAVLKSGTWSTSTVLTLVDGPGRAAASVELWPGGCEVLRPDVDGLLLHTNHFLAPEPAKDDREPGESPDTLARYATLAEHTQAWAKGFTPGALDELMCDHSKGLLSVCSHLDHSQDLQGQWTTLASIRLDFARRDLQVHAGNPCNRGEDEFFAVTTTKDRA
jgi:isopenicillin-N N-acyltransferase like protein